MSKQKEDFADYCQRKQINRVYWAIIGLHERLTKLEEQLKELKEAAKKE